MYFVLALDFGWSKTGQRSSIDDLADYVAKHYLDDEEAIVLAQSCIYDCLAAREESPMERIVKISAGQSKTLSLNEGSTYAVMEMAKQIIDEYMSVPGSSYSYDRIIRLVAHSLHAERAMQQGLTLELVLIPDGPLPTRLYPVATQWWCRNKKLWRIREVIGLPLMKLAGQI